MRITEVRIKLMGDARSSGEKLKAFCAITLDDEIVIRDLKIIEGGGGLFVAMPSRRRMFRCSHCGMKNPVRSKFCNECGRRTGHASRKFEDGEEEPASRKIYSDIAHPIHAAARRKVQEAVLAAYERELAASREKTVPLPRPAPRKAEKGAPQPEAG